MLGIIILTDSYIIIKSSSWKLSRYYYYFTNILDSFKGLQLSATMNIFSKHRTTYLKNLLRHSQVVQRITILPTHWIETPKQFRKCHLRKKALYIIKENFNKAMWASYFISTFLILRLLFYVSYIKGKANAIVSLMTLKTFWFDLITVHTFGLLISW